MISIFEFRAFCLGLSSQRLVSMYNISMPITSRSAIKPGQKVAIVLKENQRSGKLTEGIVKDILTSSPNHPHGIKVRLISGLVGRVQEIHT